jgi:hypothetical protein
VKIKLNSKRSNNEDKYPTPKFNMKEEHKNFMEKILKKSYELEYTQKRFYKLTTNLQTGNIDEKFLIEDKKALQKRAQEMYQNIR